MKLGGETEDVDQSFKDMFKALILGVIFVFAVLVLQFNKFREAFIVLATVPLSLIGVLLGLLFMREYLSFPSMLGFIALAGIVVNNAIILVDVWNRMREENPLMSLRDVVIEGAAMRLRPILLTTVTTIVGIAPLIFASDLWRPIAIAIMFGLTFAVVLTLLFVPALYLKFCKYDKKPQEEERREKLSHIGDVLKNKRYEFGKLIRSIFFMGALLLIIVTPSPLNAFTYTNDNIHTAYHEAPREFSVDERGNTTGETVSGALFTQETIYDVDGVRIQKFMIGEAFWYVCASGVFFVSGDSEAIAFCIS